ncbi:hypothetical protein F4779DRAFT_616335 [Xylariaceae sp. FL0662B]|nr:hypothetical protein F4779DRAFT_616335 [Xylariaceae sp. FL0662B]
MRSHPYTQPPPLPPLLAELSAYLPNPSRRHSSEIPLADLDPETSRLLPRQRRHHRVRIQGKLALVRSVSVANLRPPAAAVGPVSSPRDSGACSEGAARRARRRPRSEDDGWCGAEDGFEEGDAQFRGYGIGGAGNIRRPTEVIGASTKTSASLSSLFASSGSAPHSPLSFGPADKKRWGGFSEFWSRVGDRKGKGKTKVET